MIIREVGTKSLQYSPFESFHLTEKICLVGLLDNFLHFEYSSDVLEKSGCDVLTVFGD